MCVFWLSAGFLAICLCPGAFTCDETNRGKSGDMKGCKAIAAMRKTTRSTLTTQDNSAVLQTRPHCRNVHFAHFARDCRFLILLYSRRRRVPQQPQPRAVLRLGSGLHCQEMQSLTRLFCALPRSRFLVCGL